MRELKSYEMSAINGAGNIILDVLADLADALADYIEPKQ